MTIKRHLLSSATALVAIMALASTASAQTNQLSDDALQLDQQATVGECELAFQEIDEAGIEGALARDMHLMRDGALRLEEYGRTDLCLEIAEAMREISDDPDQTAAADVPGDAEDLAAAGPDTMEPSDEDFAESPDEPADAEDLAEAEPETLEPTDQDLAEAPTDPDLDEPETTGQTDALQLDEPAAADDVTELDEPDIAAPDSAAVDEEAEEQVTEAERPTETYLAMQEEDDLLANELMGANVENPEGETLGSISDIIIRDDIGVKAVVIGVGGFLGIGQKKVAVNYEEIEHRRDEYGDVLLVFAATREQLDDAPEFQTLQDQIAEAERQQMEMQQDQQMQQPALPAE